MSTYHPWRVHDLSYRVGRTHRLTVAGIGVKLHTATLTHWLCVGEGLLLAIAPHESGPCGLQLSRVDLDSLFFWLGAENGIKTRRLGIVKEMLWETVI